MVDPLVTIVTPSFNHGRFIRATIESVLSQDYPNIEYIIMDGGSTDETASVVKDYASRLNWVSEKDRGQSHAINKGFRVARGTVVSWLNSDDLILPGAVRHAVNGFQQNPDAGAVYGEGYLIDREGNTTGRFPFTEPFNLWKLVHLLDYVLQQTLYFRRSVVEEVGYLREDLHYAMDWDLLIRIGKRYPLHYIPEYMGSLREYAEAKSFSGGKKRIQEIAGILREHTGLRFPPGYIFYGLETYRTIWEDSIASKVPGLRRTSAFARRLIHVGCGYCIERTMLRSQGWYPDSWAGPAVKYMLPAGGRRLLILSGFMPRLRIGRQKLTIFANGHRIARQAFDSGDFEWRVALPKLREDEPVHLLFKASRALIPGRGSYRLQAVRTEPLADSQTEESQTELTQDLSR
jgi:glycosyltransferase involved in cell wall biosynthesis